MLPYLNAEMPQKKAFIIPASKQALKEKQKKHKNKMRENKMRETIKPKPKKIVEEGKTKTETQKTGAHCLVKKSLDQQIMEFFLNHTDPEEWFEKPRKDKKNNMDLITEVLGVKISTGDGFLNDYELNELQGIYTDLVFGDLVIVFPNPDHESVINKAVKMEDCLDLYDKVLKIDGPRGISISEMKKQRKAFIRGFLQLDNFQEELKLKKEQEAAEKEQEADEKEQEPAEKGDQDEFLKKKKLSPYENFMEKMQKYPEEKDQYIQELMKLKTNHEDDYSKLKKKYSQGGFLNKKFTDDKKDWEWECYDNQPRDFLTLIRLTIMTKLARNAHFHVRSSISSDGMYINVILKSQMESIKRFATSIGISKQYEMGYADLFSLEPIDKENRPLRLKNFIKDPEYILSIQGDLESLKDAQKNKKINLARVENRVQKILQEAEKFSESELRIQLVFKQQNVDKLLKMVANEVNVNWNRGHTELYGETNVKRDVWNAYYVYLEYLEGFIIRVDKATWFKEGVDKNNKDKFTKLKEVEDNKGIIYIIHYSKGFLYKLIFNKAIEDINEVNWNLHGNIYKGLKGDTRVLKTIWDKMFLPPLSPWGTYTNSSKNIWRQYQINEKEIRSEIIPLDRIKVSHQLLLQHIDIDMLLQMEYSAKYFPLHDPYQLHGISKIPLFKPLIDKKLMDTESQQENELEKEQKKKKKEGQARLHDLFASLKKGADPTDFVNLSLSEKAKFQLSCPWDIPIQPIREYFGEKIALYFCFVSFLSKQLFYIFVISIIIQAITDNATIPVKKGTLILFGIIIQIWSTLFLRLWSREQVLFQLKFGCTDGDEGIEIERPTFSGSFRRSIGNDAINEEYQIGWKSSAKAIMSGIVTFILIMVVIATVFGIFLLKGVLRSASTNAFVYETFPSLIQSIVIHIFNAFYYPMAGFMNAFENHKYQSTFENSFIIKTFVFIFVNTFISLFVIAFLGDLFPFLDLCGPPSQKDCFGVLKSNMISIFLVTLVRNIPELLMPFIKAYYRGEMQENDETPILHDFIEIDSYIDEQSNMEPYDQPDLDGTVGDYLEMIVLYSFLSLFGLAFPMSFFLAFINCVLELQVDKVKLFQLSLRPIPKSARTIGSWHLAIQVVNFLSAFSNAGLIIYTAEAATPNAVSFVTMVLVFLLAQYMTQFFVAESNVEEAVKERHKNAVNRIFRMSGSNIIKLKPGIGKMVIDCVEYGKIQQKVSDEHILKGPQVVFLKSDR